MDTLDAVGKISCNWQRTPQFVEFLLAAFVQDERKVPRETFRQIGALAVELCHLQGRDLRIEPSKAIFGTLCHPREALVTNRKRVSTMLTDLCSAALHSRGGTQSARKVCKSLIAISRRCVSTHAIMTLASVLSSIARGVWGDFSEVEHGGKVRYVETGIEKYMSVFGSLVPPRAVVRKGHSVSPNDHVGGLWFSRSKVEAPPMSFGFGLTLSPEPNADPFVSTSIVPSPRRASHAVATAVLCEMFSTSTVSEESTLEEIASRARQVSLRVRAMCRMIKPRCRATRGMDHLDPESMNYVHVKPSHMQSVAPMAIPILGFSAWVVKAFAAVEEEEELLLGLETSVHHSAVCVMHYAKFALAAPLAERVAAVLGARLILDGLSDTSAMFDILVKDEETQTVTTMDVLCPHLLVRWTPPAKNEEDKVELPRVPSPIHVAVQDPQLRQQSYCREKLGKWSDEVDREMFVMD